MFTFVYPSHHVKLCDSFINDIVNDKKIKCTLIHMRHKNCICIFDVKLAYIREKKGSKCFCFSSKFRCRTIMKMLPKEIGLQAQKVRTLSVGI